MATPKPPSRATNRLGRAALTALSVLAGTVVWTAWSRTQRIAFPPPRAAPSATVSFEDFVGAEACAECHQTQYEAWRQSTHGRAGGSPGADVVIAAFDGTPIHFADATVTPSITPEGEYHFTVEREGRPPVVFSVAGVLGGGHMQGGGTQGFVSAFPDGTLRFLPFDFVRRAGVWFCNTGTLTAWWAPIGGRPRPPADRGWIPISEEMVLADCGDWPPVRILGTNQVFANCQQCHGSQITVAFDREARRYETRVKSLAVNCESCHGPGKRHVEIERGGTTHTETDIGLRALATLETDEALDLCFTCHAVKRSLTPGYLPGEPFLDHYSLKAPLLTESPLFPDGRVRIFAYQQNHLASDCYLNGSMTCGDCHDSHSTDYRDIYGRPLPGRFDDGQCQDCHASKADDPTSHTHHPIQSRGGRCVSCHMPYLQHPGVGSEIRFARSDHTIPIPRPAPDSALGIEGACKGCHETISVEALQAQVATWYGELKPVKPIVAGQLRADTGALPETPTEFLRNLNVLASRRGRERPHALAIVAALSTLTERYLHPDMADLAPPVVRWLEGLAGDADADIQAIALATLHLARGEDVQTRSLLAETLGALGTRDAAVRRRWVLSLRYSALRFLRTSDVAAAVFTLRKALEVLPEDVDTHLDLASAFQQARDFTSAVEHYERALAIRPDQSQAVVNLGIALENLGREEDALAAYRRAVTINPGEAMGHFNLGNSHLNRGEYGEALNRYRLAVRYNPGFADAHFLLGQTFILLNEYDSALVAARNAVEFDPDNAAAARMLSDLLRITR